MKGLLAILAATVLATSAGCAGARPTPLTPVAAEGDPWAGFNNGYEKPAAKSESSATKSAAAPDTSDGDKTERSKPAEKDKPEATATLAADADAEEVAPQPVKKAGKGKKKGKKSAGKHVAGKKPKKRAKRAS